MKPFTSKHMFGASCKSTSPLKQQAKPEKGNPRTKEAYANISSKSHTLIDNEIQENKRRVLVEARAKNDSVTAAGNRRTSGGNKFQQGMAGNKAANKTRKAGGAHDMTVLRGKSVGSGGFTSQGDVTYTRDKPVEKDFTRLKLNKKTGMY